MKKSIVSVILLLGMLTPILAECDSGNSSLPNLITAKMNDDSSLTAYMNAKEGCTYYGDESAVFKNLSTSEAVSGGNAVSGPMRVPQAPIGTDQSTFINGSLFSENLAWVQYFSYGNVVTAVIDTKGNEIFREDTPVLYFSTFEDGFAFYVTCPNAVSRVGRQPTRAYCSTVFEWDEWYSGIFFHIIDSSGNKIDVDYRLLAYGDGQFLAASYVSSFDLAEWRIGTIDSSGNIINEFKNYTWEFWSDDYTFQSKDFAYENFEGLNERYRYVGEGIFLLHGDKWAHMFFYNVRTQGLSFRDGRHTQLFSNFHNGVALGTNGDGNRVLLNTTGSRVGSTYFDKERVFGEFDRPGWGFSYVNAIENSNPEDWIVGEGLMYYDHIYYDLDGNAILTFPQYNEKAMFGGPFSGGYAALLVVGADNNPYVTVIDRNGIEQFSPRQVDRINFYFSEGFLVINIGDTVQVLNSQGSSVYKFGYVDGDGFRFDTSKDGAVHNGILRKRYEGGWSYMLDYAYEYRQITEP